MSNNYQPVRKYNLNRVTSPWTTAIDYNFADCIENKMMEKLGCRPFWINDTGTKFSFCQQQSQYVEHFNRTYKFLVMNDEEIIEEFGCVKPCTYMEYKV